MLHLLFDPTRPEYFRIALIIGVVLLLAGAALYQKMQNDQTDDRYRVRALQEARFTLLVGVCVLIFGLYGVFVALVIGFALSFVQNK